MRSFQQKKGWRSIMQSKPVLVFLSILALIFAYSVIGFMGRMRTTMENRRIAEDKVAQLLKQKEELSSKIVKLSTKEGKEESIRERFPVAKEGEGVIVIIEDQGEPRAEEGSSSGFFNFVKNLFR